MVTHAPLLFCPPVMGPLSRSEKKICGGALCAETSATEKISNSREPIFDDLSINHSNLANSKHRGAEQNVSYSGHRDGHSHLSGRRALRTACIQRGDHIEIFLP